MLQVLYVSYSLEKKFCENPSLEIYLHIPRFSILSMHLTGPLFNSPDILLRKQCAPL